jgi:serine/threonine protein kinase
MIDSVEDFLHALRRSRLMNPAQLNGLRSPPFEGIEDPHVFAEELVQRGWLTFYQVEQLMEGNDRELVLDSYRLLKLLGEGGLCQVFKALDTRNQNVVALKVLHPELRSNAEVLEQLRLEMAVIAKLGHPAFVKAVDVQLEGARYYFAMEYVAGMDLAKLLASAGPLPVGQGSDFIRQACLGLQYAYEQGLVHRDIKPSNLMAPYKGEQLRILDIGLARLEWSYAEPGLEATPSPATPARGVALMGTPDYVAPEQALNPDEADIRSDIYSLGCTFFHLLTGQPPYPGASLSRKLLQHQQAPVPLAHQLRPDVPPELTEVIRKMMAKQPGDRFRTPAAAAVALAPFTAVPGQKLNVEHFRSPESIEEDELLQLAKQQATAAAAAEPAVAPPKRESKTVAIPFGSPGFPERRAHARRGGNLTAVLAAADPKGKDVNKGYVLDRSATGLGLLLADPLEIGTQIYVRPDQPQHATRWTVAKVIYCFQERIRWRVGCAFTRELKWDELRLFG